jgi:hypothetical protein
MAVLSKSIGITSIRLVVQMKGHVQTQACNTREKLQEVSRLASEESHIQTSGARKINTKA